MHKGRKPWGGGAGGLHAGLSHRKHQERRALHTFTPLSIMRGDLDWAIVILFINPFSNRIQESLLNIRPSMPEITPILGPFPRL